jgi:N,N'-diacetylchitobiose transport system substrate-binding protein
MRVKRRLLVAAGVAAALTGMAACGGSDGDKKSTDNGGSSSSAKAEGGGGGGGGKTVTVWLMKGTAPDDFIASFKSDFEAKHAGTKLNVQIQEWNGIGPKITSALASKGGPDVIEAGNTQVEEYAASGGVKDLTSKVDELGGKDWVPGLANPAKVGGKQFGVPLYAANRVVIYNKDMWAAAGLTDTPKTRDEWIAATEKLNQGDQQGIYLPGKNWYFYAGLLGDEGGQVAAKNGDKWKGGVGTPQGVAAAEFYKKLQALGKGPKDSDEATPQQSDVVAQGKIAQFVGVPGEAATVIKANPALKDKFGFFPIPGKTADKPGSVVIGGSDLIIPESSGNQDLAYEVVKAFNSDEWQTKLAKAQSYVPNKTSLAGAVSDDPGSAAQAKAATNGITAPSSPNWAAVEAKNPIKDYLTKFLTGGDPMSAGKDADSNIEKALNAKQ